ncbi:uncharacterized protein PHA67_002868 isoform 1-T1 [Liasis olivaceus]
MKTPREINAIIRRPPRGFHRSAAGDSLLSTRSRRGRRGFSRGRNVARRGAAAAAATQRRGAGGGWGREGQREGGRARLPRAPAPAGPPCCPEGRPGAAASAARGLRRPKADSEEGAGPRLGRAPASASASARQRPPPNREGAPRLPPRRFPSPGAAPGFPGGLPSCAPSRPGFSSGRAELPRRRRPGGGGRAEPRPPPLRPPAPQEQRRRRRRRTRGGRSSAAAAAPPRRASRPPPPSAAGGPAAWRRFRVESAEKAMNEPRSAGTERELEGAEKPISAVQRQHKTERLGWGTSQKSRRESCRGMQERWEAQLQQFLKSLQPILTGRGNSVMPEASPWEDAKAFLASFEQVAKACRWPRERWAAHLLPALSGEAEAAFRSLEARDQENYEKVKAAILRGEALRTELQRQHFRQFCCQEVEDPRRIHSQLQELCCQWLRPERRTKEQILELLILEQFLASLPPELRSWIQARRPDTCSQAVALVEDFLMSQQEAKSRTSQGRLKGKPVDFLVAEKEPLNAVKGPIYGETDPNVDANLLGNGPKYPSLSPLPFPPEGEEVGQTGGKEGSRDLKETGGSLQIVKQSLTPPGQQTMLWQVLQENDDTNTDILGDEMGNYIKVEISQCGEAETQDTCRMEPQVSYDHVPVKREKPEGRCESQDPQGGSPVGTGNECIELAEVHWKRYQRTPVPNSLPREGAHGIPEALPSNPPPPKKPRNGPEHSVVWDHFELDSEDPCYGICTHCKRRVSRGKNSKHFSTSGLLKHLQRHHGNIVLAAIATTRAVLPTSSKSKAPVVTQSALPQCWTKQKLSGKRQPGPKPSEVTRAIAQMMALDDQPFSMVEDTGFQHLLKLLAPNYKIPSCTTFSRQVVPSLYQACREEVLGMLQTTGPPASVNVSSDE